MDYLQALDYLNSLQFNLKGFDLRNMEKLIALSKLPAKELKVVHIAGTKGKGSTAAFISSILREAGYKAGAYTSPHLLSERERIAINGKKIPEKDFASLANYFKHFSDKMEKKPSYFETLTAMAIKYFLDKTVDFSVVETGLGGRLDATNILEGIVCTITDISLEHTETLGDRIESIASEKAGIIKEGSFVVFQKQNSGARIFEDAARERGCRVINPEIEHLKVTKDYSLFNSKKPKLKKLKIKLIGRHQLNNAAVSLGAIEALRQQGFPIPDSAIRKGLLKAEWPGRMQAVKRKPFVIIDAAHTPDACKAAMESVKLFRYKRLILVFSCLSNKNAEGMLKELHWDGLIIAKLRNSRAMQPEKILNAAKGKGRIIGNISDAIKEAEKVASKKDLILITGSTYSAAEALEYFKIKI